MNKLWGTGAIIGLVFLAIIAFGNGNSEKQILSGRFERGCVASSTAWTVGPGNFRTVLPTSGLRASFTLSNENGTKHVYYRLDSATAATGTGVFLAASSTDTYTETYPYRGVVRVSGVDASSTLLVTECLYTN